MHLLLEYGYVAALALACSRAACVPREVPLGTVPLPMCRAGSLEASWLFFDSSGCVPNLCARHAGAHAM